MSGQLSKISRTNLEKAFLRFVENSPDDKKLFEMNSRAKTFLSFHNNIEEIRFIEDLDGERKEELEGHICIECHGDLTARSRSISP